MNYINKVAHMLIVFVAILPSTSSAVCGLAFLNSEGPPTIGGGINPATEWSDASVINAGDACLDNLPDSFEGASEIANITTGTNTVKFYSKRFDSDLYLAVDVNDQTIPDSGLAADRIFERLYLYFNPDNSNDPSLQGDEHRIEIRYNRATAPTVRISGAVPGSGGDPGAWDTLVVTSEIEVSATEKSVPPGYQLEVRIPIASIGYSFSSESDLGFAIALVNDNDFSVDLDPGDGLDLPVRILTGVALPNDLSLNTVTGADDVLETVGPPGSWNTPGGWGEAYLWGAGVSMYMSHNPAFWKSEDIVTAFCTASSFDTTGPRSSSNPLWYKYNRTGTPCQLRLWGKVRRGGRLVGLQQRRVLYLWGEHSINGREWNFLHLTDPIDFDPASSPGSGSEIYEISPTHEWTGMNPGLGGHPCLRAFVLPAQLRPGDEAFFATIQGSGTGTGTGNWNIVQSRVIDAYGLTRSHQAQSNIFVIDEVATCPESSSAPPNCVAPIDSSSRETEGIKLASLDMSGLLLADSHTTTAGTGLTDPGGRVVVDDPLPILRDAIFNVEAFGVATGVTNKRYAFAEPLGGVQEIVNINYLKKQGAVSVPVKVSNSDDYSRVIATSTTQVTPRDQTGLTLDIDISGGVFKAGETRVAETRVAQDTQDGPNGCGCFDITCHFKKIFD